MGEDPGLIDLGDRVAALLGEDQEDVRRAALVTELAGHNRRIARALAEVAEMVHEIATHYAALQHAVERAVGEPAPPEAVKIDHRRIGESDG